MRPSENKSRPQYALLTPDPHAALNIITAEGQGADAVLRLMKDATQTFQDRTVILYVGDHRSATRLLNPTRTGVEIFPTVEALLARLDALLADAKMGLRLYSTGVEGFIGQVTQRAERAGVDHKAVRAEHRGSLARRVQCIHCKGVTENVTTTIVTCEHCGVKLAVRDHYSRRLAAFMAVCADAESPGENVSPEAFQ
jgi:dimethylamine monooxygenase subunit C